MEIASDKLQKNKYSLFQKLVVSSKYGDFYYTKQEYNKALNFYLQSLEIAKKMKKKDQTRNLYQSISSTYKALKNEKKSAEYLQKYYLLNDSLNIESRKALNFSVNKVLKDKDEEKEAERRNLTLKNTYIIISIIFLSAVLISFVYVELKRRTLKKRKIIQEQELRLSEKRFKLKEREVEIEQLRQKVDITVQEILQLAKQNHPSFLARFKDVYPEFCEKLLILQPDLLNSEFTFCAYLKLNFSTKEIANYTFVTEKAVQSRKSRIRKKFNIPSEEDLYIWISKM